MTIKIKTYIYACSTIIHFFLPTSKSMQIGMQMEIYQVWVMECAWTSMKKYNKFCCEQKKQKQKTNNTISSYTMNEQKPIHSNYETKQHNQINNELK